MKSNNILFYTSGLGNALFQFAGLISIARINLEEIEAYDYLTKKNQITTLLRWTIHHNYVNKENINLKKMNVLGYYALFLLFIKTYIKKIKVLKHNCSKGKSSNSFSYSKVNIFGSNYYFGYFQDKLYLTREAGKKLTSKLLGEDLLKNKIDKNSLVIHIRQGDFSSKIQLDYSYYVKAINYISRNQTNDIENIYIVGIYSNTIFKKISDLVKSNFTKSKIIAPKGNALIDFITIWNSEYSISSNSTFSFWSTYYGNSKMNCYPKIFRKYTMEKDEKIMELI